MIDIDKAKQEYESKATMGIRDFLNEQLELHGTKSLMERYTIMRDSLWEVTKNLNDSDACDVSDAIFVIECIRTELRGKPQNKIRL